MNRTSFRILALIVAALACVPACGASVALENRPCPCAAGWTCCDQKNICVAPGTVCPASATPDSSTSGDPGDAATTNPTTLANAQSARCMTTDRDHVYWQNSNGLIVGAPKAGGELQISRFQTPIANDARCGLAVDGSTIFGTSYEYGKLVKLTLESNGEWVLGASASMFGTLSGPSSIALDETWIYVTEYDGGTVKKQPKSGSGDAIVLASGLAHPLSIVLDDTNVYWLNHGTSSVDGGIDASAPNKDGAVMRVSKNGGVVTTLVTGLPYPDGLAIHGGRLYWMEFAGNVSAIDIDGQNRTVLSSLESGIGAIAADGESVFWGGSFNIRKVAHEGGKPVSMYPISGIANTLVVDDKRVYWANGDEVWTGLK